MARIYITFFCTVMLAVIALTVEKPDVGLQHKTAKAQQVTLADVLHFFGTAPEDYANKVEDYANEVASYFASAFSSSFEED